jgi:hypothetical protein
MPIDHEALFKKMAKALTERRFDDMQAQLTEDYVEDYPQSGEVIRGAKNARAVREYYPGGGFQDDGIEPATARIVPGEERWVRTPTFTFVRAEGSGNKGTAAYRGRYPDGSLWWVIVFYELRGERIARSTFFFAPEFAAPDWRKPFREPILARVT